MALTRGILPFVGALLLALLVAACGDDASSNGGDERRGAASQGESGPAPSGEDEAPERGPGAEERAASTGGGGIAISPAVASCLRGAGYEPLAPAPGGSVAAWRAGAATVAVATDEDAAADLAQVLAADGAEGTVDGRIAGAGPSALRDAGIDCLRPATAEDA